jgi:nitroreductase
MSRTADLSTAIQHALRAPSVHNTQPWRWRIGPDGVQLHADWTRHLAWTDPDRRDLVLSCGAALHHLRVALAAQGVAVHVDRLPDAENEGHLATVTVPPGTPDRETAALFPAIFRRRTERRQMGHRAVPATLLSELAARAHRENTRVLPVTGTDMRNRLISTLRTAAHEQAVAPGYAAELQLWTHRYAGSHDGVAVENVAASPPGLVGESPLREFPRAGLAQPRNPAGSGAPDDAAELLIFATTHDDHLAWLRAGEALSAVLLEATNRGLATTPLSQGIEMSNTRDEVRQRILRTSEYPQLVLRVGWPAPRTTDIPATSRRDLRSVLTVMKPAASHQS